MHDHESAGCPGKAGRSGGIHADEGVREGEIRTLHDGYSDGLEPLACLDLGAIRSCDELVRAMSRTSFAGRGVGEAADVFEAMIRDPDCVVVMTLSGAMTIAKMGLVICDMIEHGWIQGVVSTGALMAHGFVEAAGGQHFKYDPRMGDDELYEKGYDRVYDTLELERSLDDVEIILSNVLRTVPPGTHFGSVDLHRWLGKWLSENVEGRGVLKSAYAHGVPVYVPAFTDSEIGLDVALHIRRCRMAGIEPPVYDGFIDLEHYTQLILSAKECGIFTIGGGVPRNWAQQVAPYLEISKVRLKIDSPLRQFTYGVRLCPEPVHWGGLSGCTYIEGVSWGKFKHPNDGGRFSEVMADATVTWPLIAKALMERFEKDPPPKKAFAVASSSD